MKNNKILLPLLTAALLASCGTPTTGNSTDKPVETPSSSQIELQEYDMSGVSFADVTTAYDGKPKSIEITGVLPAGVSVTYEGNGQVNAGTYTIIAKFKGDDKHKPIADMSAKLVITKAAHDMTAIKFNDASFSYDGKPKSLAIEGKLPEGVTVTYEGNNQTNAGAHTVTAKFTVDGNHEPIPSMTATLTITKATVDMSKVTFDDLTTPYDGQPKELKIKGELPAGVTGVTYTETAKTDVGVYPFTAKFTVDGNHEPVADMTATLTITKGTFVPQFNDLEAYYDGTAKSIVVENELPAGITVTYEGNGQTNPGTYQVTAKFTVSGNYEPIADMTATLTIKYTPWAYTREDFQAKGVTLERLNDKEGTMIYRNGTSGISTGDNQNWGESGIFFLEIQDPKYDTFASLGFRYVKFDVLFEDSVQGFNLRYGTKIPGDYHIENVGFDQPLPQGRELNIFDANGKRVTQITHNTWYTMYLKVTNGSYNSFWTNGGSMAAPAVTKIRNVSAEKSVLTSVTPYFKDWKGTSVLATEPGFEGAYKLTKNDPNDGNSPICFSGITHTASPDGMEYAGGFFDDNANRYFIFDYFVSDTNNAFYLECKGTGFAGQLGQFCGPTMTADKTTIYQNGAQVQNLQAGWNTVQIDIEHTAGGWTDFLFNLGGSEGYIRDAHYSTTPLK